MQVNKRNRFSAVQSSRRCQRARERLLKILLPPPLSVSVQSRQKKSDQGCELSPAKLRYDNAMSSLNVVPQELDWVSKRAACTIGQVFNKLCNEIEGDVSAINTARNLVDMDRFFIDNTGDGRTIIIGQPSRLPRVVVKIGVVGNEIEVQDEATQIRWRVGIGLNNEGRCVLRDSDRIEMENWQFRRSTLEPLFFGSMIKP
jgi:hypothetical protein